MTLSKRRCYARADIYEHIRNFLFTADWADAIEKEECVRITGQMYDNSLVWQEKEEKRE